LVTISAVSVLVHLRKLFAETLIKVAEYKHAFPSTITMLLLIKINDLSNH